MESNIYSSWPYCNTGEVNLDWLLNQMKIVIDRVDVLNTSFTELEKYVRDYFANLDVSAKVNKKLDEMVADGTFAKIINEQIFNELDARVKKNSAAANLVEPVSMNPYKTLDFLPQAICKKDNDFYITGSPDTRTNNVYKVPADFSSREIVGQTQALTESIFFLNGYFYTTEAVAGLKKYDPNFNFIKVEPVLGSEVIHVACRSSDKIFVISYAVHGSAEQIKITTLSLDFEILDNFVVTTTANQHVESAAYYDGFLYIGTYFDRDENANTKAGMFKVNMESHDFTFATIPGCSKNCEFEDFYLDEQGRGFAVIYYNIGSRNFCAVYKMDVTQHNYAPPVSRGLCDYGTTCYVNPSAAINGTGTQKSPFNDLQTAIDMSSKYARSVIHVIGDYLGGEKTVTIGGYSNLLIECANHKLNYAFRISESATVRISNATILRVYVDRSTLYLSGAVNSGTKVALYGDHSRIDFAGKTSGATLLTAAYGSFFYIDTTTTCTNLGALNHSQIFGKISGKTGNFTGTGGADNTVKS